MNPVEYIRRDSEGSDSDTRRRAAADLVKALVDKFPAEVTQFCTGYVQVRAPPRSSLAASCPCFRRSLDRARPADSRRLRLVPQLPRDAPRRPCWPSTRRPPPRPGRPRTAPSTWCWRSPCAARQVRAPTARPFSCANATRAGHAKATPRAAPPAPTTSKRPAAHLCADYPVCARSEPRRHQHQPARQRAGLFRIPGARPGSPGPPAAAHPRMHATPAMARVTCQSRLWSFLCLATGRCCPSSSRATWRPCPCSRPTPSSSSPPSGEVTGHLIACTSARKGRHTTRASTRRVGDARPACQGAARASHVWQRAGHAQRARRVQRAAPPGARAHRSLLPKEALLTALPSLVKLLTCSSYVVHSYAATCVEKMLAIKVRWRGTVATPRRAKAFWFGNQSARGGSPALEPFVMPCTALDLATLGAMRDELLKA